jgi:hypothetical protein
VNLIERDGVRNAAIKPKLMVRICNATNLRTREGFLQGEVHPKVIVEVPGKPGSKWETKAAADGANVQWNEIGTVNGWYYGDALRIRVADSSWLGFAGETHLGEARLQASDFYPSDWRTPLPLLNAGPKGNTQKTGSRSPSPSPRGGSGPKGGYAMLNLEIHVEEPNGKGSNWPPQPVMYAPLHNLNDSDRETQRLANWDVHQNAKLPFADVNPNYQINQDIWGAMADGKTVDQAVLLPKKESWRNPRVKDECPMS